MHTKKSRKLSNTFHSFNCNCTCNSNWKMNNNFICNRSTNWHAEFISICKRNKWRAVAEQTVWCFSKVLSIGLQYVYYFRTHKRQWNRRQIIRWKVRKLDHRPVSDFCSRERKFQGTKVPGFQGANVPGSKSSWNTKYKSSWNFRSLEQKFQGTKVPGRESSIPWNFRPPERKFHNSSDTPIYWPTCPADESVWINTWFSMTPFTHTDMLARYVGRQ